MTVVFFHGDCWPDPGGVMAFAYSVGDGHCQGCGVLDGELPVRSAEVASWVALGKALALLVATKSKVEDLRLVGDCRAVLDGLTGKAEPAVAWLKTLRDECRARLRALSPKSVQGECVPAEQLEFCATLARAAYVGRVGLVPTHAKEGR